MLFVMVQLLAASAKPNSLSQYSWTKIRFMDVSPLCQFAPGRFGPN